MDGARSISIRLSVASFLSILVAALPVSCARPTPPEAPTASAVSSDSLDDLWHAALRVLVHHEMAPDRQDRVAGVITSLPTTSGQWFEWWRQDTADRFSHGQANLQTIRRRATVQFVKQEPPGEWDIQVQVDVERLTIPAYQVTSASAAIQSFSGVLPTAEGEVRDPAAARRWQPLGRDGAMEDMILAQILQRAGVPAASE